MIYCWHDLRRIQMSSSHAIEKLDLRCGHLEKDLLEFELEEEAPKPAVAVADIGEVNCF